MFLWATSVITFLPGSPHGWQMSTCPWGWFILQHWVGLRRVEKLRIGEWRETEGGRKRTQARQRRWKWGLKRNESGLITGHLWLSRQTFSWIMSDKPEHASVVFNVNTQYIMISCCGGGNREWYVADDRGGSVCRWERMKQALKVRV